MYRKSSIAESNSQRRTSLRSSYSCGSQLPNQDLEGTIVDPSSLSYMASVPVFSLDGQTVGQNEELAMQRQLLPGSTGDLAHASYTGRWIATDAPPSSYQSDYFGSALPGFSSTTPLDFNDAQAFQQWTNMPVPSAPCRQVDVPQQIGRPILAMRPTDPNAQAPTGNRPVSQGSNMHGEGIQSNEREGRFRTHEYYRASQKSDGLYHCPFQGCGHKPTKLKCNYEFVHH
ncbi:hypothetical protein CAC42_4625 [Sphaceloma murrayae]|uniref:C2H2-type domain-containing protein n=1 Tax=Sphaceloma murrayae TaxID=2082308 RepID=A0A2K1QNR4_9PEZI|nr:hypothetical protein CAC42_4625 [Sphaceloma murrayae]